MPEAQEVDDFDPGFNDRVMSTAVLTDGRILAGGEFTEISGSTSRRLGLVDEHGNVVPGFTTGVSEGSNPGITSLTLQSDGRMVIAGNFWKVAGRDQANIARLNADGTLDPSFRSGTDGYINPIVLEADGTLLVGGYFNMLAGQPRSNLGRILANGSADSAFNPGADGNVRTLAVDSMGRILVGGGFQHLAGSPRRFLGRLSPQGVLDPSFNPGQESEVSVLAVLPDDSVLVGGTTLRRVRSDGTTDPDFNLSLGPSGVAMSVCVQANGAVVVGGRFNRLGTHVRNFLGRLTPEGTVDAGFNPGANGGVLSVALQQNGSVLLGGEFQMLGGKPRRYAGRLSNPEAAEESLEMKGRTLRWLRGGSCPEVWRTTFEHSNDGTSWRRLGAGVRIRGGWELADVSIPESGMVRALGQVAGGLFNGSGWFLESRRSAPWPLRLRVTRIGNGARLSWTGGQAPFQVQQATHLTEPIAWRDMGRSTSDRLISIPTVSTDQYFRVKGR
ncbi:MAG: delta-60 repeat domain-containing protein [Verrucomicrobiales bacterium]|nr:delta-60 repeat domain-containing protein [Verrucomicrobiales bacterium]